LGRSRSTTYASSVSSMSMGTRSSRSEGSIRNVGLVAICREGRETESVMAAMLDGPRVTPTRLNGMTCNPTAQSR
jgi:hypothetical protein